MYLNFKNFTALFRELKVASYKLAVNLNIYWSDNVSICIEPHWYVPVK